jgi:predicted DNA-binding ribbon-helix-helix protein
MVGAVRISHERHANPKSTSAGTVPPAGADAMEKPLTRMFALCPTNPEDEYMPVRRSIRLHGHSTTIRLEKAFWVVLEELAAKEGSTLAALITRIYDHCLGTNQKNLASCLRVVSLKYIETCD